MGLFEIVHKVLYSKRMLWIDLCGGRGYDYNHLGMKAKRVKFISCVICLICLIIIKNQSCVKFEWWVITCTCTNYSGIILCGQAVPPKHLISSKIQVFIDFSRPWLLEHYYKLNSMCTNILPHNIHVHSTCVCICMYYLMS